MFFVVVMVIVDVCVVFNIIVCGDVGSLVILTVIGDAGAVSVDVVGFGGCVVGSCVVSFVTIFDGGVVISVISLVITAAVEDVVSSWGNVVDSILVADEVPIPDVVAMDGVDVVEAMVIVVDTAEGGIFADVVVDSVVDSFVGSNVVNFAFVVDAGAVAGVGTVDSVDGEVISDTNVVPVDVGVVVVFDIDVVIIVVGVAAGVVVEAFRTPRIIITVVGGDVGTSANERKTKINNYESFRKAANHWPLAPGILI